MQLHRATDSAQALAESRGHTPLRLTMKPSFANLIVWKSIYEYQGYYYVDGIRTGLNTSWCPGERVVKLDVARHFPELSPSSQQATDIERFRWFSDDYLALYDGDVVDMRYSMVPNEVDPMWGLKIDPGKADDAHVSWFSERALSPAKRSAFGDMLTGNSCP